MQACALVTASTGKFLCFLAHVWALTMTYCPSSSSVSRAHFVTAGAIDLKLCTPLVCRPNFGPILFLAWLPGGQNWKCKKCYNSWTNGWIISKFLSWVHLVRIHDIIPGFLIWPTFQGHRGLKFVWVRYRARFVTARAIDLKLCTFYVPLCHLTSQTKFRSDLILDH
jgi:hypothetical protein